MARYVNLEEVRAGCNQIDAALDKYAEVKKRIDNATGLLNANNLKFGDINSSLDEQLAVLRILTEKCSTESKDVTSTIMANAQAQYNEYMESLQAKNKAGNGDTTRL